MGGDFAPRNIVDGALVAARHLGTGLTLVGVAADLRRELERHDAKGLDLRIIDAPDVVGMEESPSAALRRKPRASICVAADTVARGEAAACFSAGNTGAALLAAHAAFGVLPGVDRPALATTIPTLDRGAVLLDSGANVECRGQHLVQFAVMGAVYARVALGCRARPRRPALDRGGGEQGERVEPATLTGCSGRARSTSLATSRPGTSTPDRPTSSCATGFTGNIALKISEGLVEVIEELLRDELSRTFSTRVGYLLSRRAFRRFRKRVDYSEYGGAPLLGVGGLCIVGHGRSSAKAVRNAVAMATRLASQDCVPHIAREDRRHVCASRVTGVRIAPGCAWPTLTRITP